MTYTVIGVSQEDGRLGVGIATYSIGVGGYCPFIERGVAALSTQAFANPALGPPALAALREGADPEAVLARLAAEDPGFAFRQVVIATADGRVAAHTGPRTRPWSGHVTGDGFAAFGNVLAGARTVDAMADAWRETGWTTTSPNGSSPRSRRVGMRAARRTRMEPTLPSGRAPSSCGARTSSRTSTSGSTSTTTRSDELRRLYDRYRVYLPYYALRARSPAETPAQDVWAKENDPATA